MLYQKRLIYFFLDGLTALNTTVELWVVGSSNYTIDWLIEFVNQIAIAHFSRTFPIFMEHEVLWMHSQESAGDSILYQMNLFQFP
jgi:hypothetical protein